MQRLLTRFSAGIGRSTALLMMLLLPLLGWGQVNITPGGAAVTQNFDAMGNAAGATLPTGWKADKLTTIRAVGTYASAGTVTNNQGGASLATGATNGIYNFGEGSTTAGNGNRAVGGLSSGSASTSVNVYSPALTNTGATNITSFTISYNVEKYRNGSNAAGFRIQLYYSTNGSTWTVAPGTDFTTAFGADANNNGASVVPISQVGPNNQTLTLTVAPATTVYFAWNYSVTTGTTTSNAQALAVDDISISPVGGTPTPTPTITVGPLTPAGSFSTVEGTASASKTYSLDGSDLTANLTVGPLTGYEFSTDGFATAGAASLSLVPSTGTISTTVSVRIAATATAAGSPYNGNIANASTGATTRDVAVTGTVVGAATAPAGVSTTAATAITFNSATSGGAVTTDGGSAITGRGVVFSTTPNPQIGGSGVTAVTATGTTGTFTSSLTGLSASTFYYVAAYATNGVGTTYGTVVTFTTTAPPTAPTGVTTTAATAITFNSATSGGAVGTDGGSTITGRGIVYGTTPNPQIGGSGVTAVTAIGTTGTFTSSLTGLAGGTAYYVAAYATNSVGTTYGPDQTFTTLAAPLLGYNFTSGDTPSTQNANVAGSAFTRTGVTLNAGAGRFNSTSWPASTLDDNKYVQFTFSPSAGYLADLTSLTFVDQRSASTAGAYAVRVSTDGFATSPTTLLTGTTSGGAKSATISGLTGVGPGTTVTFRFYYANSGTYSVDDVNLYGTVTAAVPGTIIVSTNGPLAVGATTLGTPSTSPVSYTVGGTSLGVSPLVVQAPAGFQVSLDAAFTGITADANSLSLTPASGTMPTTTIYVRLSGSGTPGALSGNVTNTSGVSPVQSVAVTGTLNSTPAEINLKQGATSYASNGAAYTGFTTIALGGFVDRTFTIENLGGTALTLGTFTAAGDFSVTGTPPTTVAALGTATFTVRFQPTLTGTRTGSVSIVNSDSDENPYVLNLSADATAAAPSITWTGTAGDNSFFTPANWSGNAVPGASDRVLLDHSSVAGAYTVVMDGGSTPTVAVDLISLTVNPGAGPAIELNLPATNTVADGLTLTNTTTGEAALAIYANGIVNNRSGANSGTGITIDGVGPTFFIFNGGLYRHANGRSSSSVTENLSGVSGTENGTFAFNQAPASAGTPITLALQGRTFGNLTFEAADAAGYSSVGSSPTVINGNLTINSGTVFTNNLTTTTLRGNLVVDGNATFGGDVLNLSGSTSQVISGTALTGGSSSLGNSLAVQVNNPAGVVLQTSVRIPGQLTLTSGIVTTTATNLLTLSTTTVLSGGSATSYVSGPLARDTPASISTATAYAFPIGKAGIYRPFTLNLTAQVAASTYTAEQIEGDPNPAGAANLLPGNGFGSAPLKRVSKFRGFALASSNATNNNAFGTITLSFGAGDGVNNPADAGLVVGVSSGGSPFGNLDRSAATGTGTGAGGADVVGTLTSTTIPTAAASALFVLGATNDNNTIGQATNPLPVELTSFTAQRQASSAVDVKWATASEKNSNYFQVQRSLDGREFATIATVTARGTSSQATAYTALDKAAPAAQLYYRLRQVDLDGTATFSPVVTVAGTGRAALQLYPNPTTEVLHVEAAAATPYRVLNLLGQPVLTGTTTERTTLNVQTLPAGAYLLELSTAQGRLVSKFTKE